MTLEAFPNVDLAKVAGAKTDSSKSVPEVFDFCCNLAHALSQKSVLAARPERIIRH